MKDKIKLIYCIIFFTICLVPLCIYPFAKNTKQIGNTKLSELPNIISDEKINTSFSTEFEKYVSDTMPGRAGILTAANFIESEIFAATTANVVKGENGWLFFAKTLDDYKGVNQLSDRELDAVTITLLLIEEQIEAKGGYFVFAPVPNKNSIYPEYMPKVFEKCEDNNLTRLYEKLDTAGVRYADLLTELKGQKELAALYHKKDTHWNSLGALIGYNCITNKLEKNHESYNNTEFNLEKNWSGDLEELIYPITLDKDYQYYSDYEMSDFEFTYPASSQSKDELLTEFMGASEEKDLKIISQKKEKTDDSKLYMVRDSFGRALLPYMIEAYDEATFVRTDCPEVATLSERTDFVYEIAQRNIKDILNTAPYMYAPLRSEEELNIKDINLISADEKNNDVAYIKDEGYAIRIYGTISTKLLGDDGRIYVKLKEKFADEEQINDYLFEAFPIYENNIMEEPLNEEAEGFSMMLNSESIEKGTYEIYVMSGNNRSEKLTELEVK